LELKKLSFELKMCERQKSSQCTNKAVDLECDALITQKRSWQRCAKMYPTLKGPQLSRGTTGGELIELKPDNNVNFKEGN